jgi:HSP20 family molecular chaperone IbpA
MAWNDIVSNAREKLRRAWGPRDGEEEVQVAAQAPRLEQLDQAALATPAVDIYENDKELLIHADVPGGHRDGAVVAWDERRGLTLSVKGRALPAGTPRVSEYQAHDWYRVFELPNNLDGSKATSSIKDGVLAIRIPKRAAASKLIPVKAG